MIDNYITGTKKNCKNKKNS